MSVYIRMHEDLCTVSLDTTGAHLHQRGQLKLRGQAPLRETTAAFCLRKLIGQRSAAEIKTVSLIDPMAGSGTFLSEAQSFYQLHEHRDFSFFKFKNCPRVLREKQWQQNYLPMAQGFQNLFGFDQDAEMVAIAQKNLLQIAFSQADLFLMEDLSPRLPFWLILNPPYGERIKTSFAPNELLSQLVRVFRPKRVGILWGPQQIAHAPKVL